VRRGALVVLLGLFALAPSARADEALETALKAFDRARKAPEWKARQDAFIALSGQDGPGVAEAMLQALSTEQNAAVVRTGITCLGDLRATASQEALAAALRKGRGSTRLYALLAVEKGRGQAVEEALFELLADKDAPVVAQAALALGARGLATAPPRLVPLLEHRGWQVRAAAARALLRLASPPPPRGEPGKPPPPPPPPPDWVKTPEVTAALIAALEAGKGRERTDVIAALERLHGRDLGDNLAAWRLVAEGKEVDAVTAAKRVWGAHVFGIPIRGRRVVFVLDNSLRAKTPHKFGAGDRLAQVCEVPGGLPLLGSRLGLSGSFAHAHLARCVEDLASDVRFNVVTFNEKVRPLFERPVGSNPGTRKQLEETLAALEPDDGVACYDALVAGLDLWGAKDGVAWDKGPDEIVFVSFNAPTKGEVLEADVIAAAIGLKARLRMVAIHTIGVTEHAYDMCAQIAAESGGVYRNYYQ